MYLSITQEVREKVRFLSPTYHRKGRHRRGLLTLHLLNEGLLDIGRPIVFPTDEKNYSPLMAIVPGMNHWNQGVPDVMRGEETQVFGAMGGENQHVIYILPGTHSKWVLTREGRIEDFVTFMSGELFSVLKEHSILGKLMQGDSSHQESFDRGCLQAFESPFGLLSQLFSARMMGLLNKLKNRGFIHSYRVLFLVPN